VQELGTLPLVRQGASENRVNRQAVCVCERIAAAVLLALALPLLAVAALILWMTSGRAPVIAHRRVGRQGTTLWMLKLRTMWGRPGPQLVQARAGLPSGLFERVIERIEDDDGPALKNPRDPRVRSRFARFCRRHSIDELPQLWHVITGEMSLVGPRPMTERELRRHYGADAGEILQVKPGLAGLWQISGRNRLTYAERRRLDLKLVRELTVPMYFRILLRTVPEVLGGENSW
jgi:lipopolysaccharide/colanic/teichoic acid biosynthesis glycosyltransferase